MSLILGIETSCDETAASVLRSGREVLSNVVASQVDLHRKYGGVVPEIASRAHLERLDAVIEEALEIAACDPTDLEALAVTYAPGLIGSLLIGVTAAKTLAWAWGRPLVAVNHIHAHAVSAELAGNEAIWPAVALVASGGHTSLFHVRSPLEIERLGSTTDDAAGEAFDKVAAILGLAYPGGPEIDRAAREGDSAAVEFPRTLLGPDSLDFSFSGIKTAVLYHVNGPGKTSGGLERLNRQAICDIAASFQQAVVDVLVQKTLLAAARKGVDSIVVGGGVAANRHLRECLAAACHERNYRLTLTPSAFCGDNGAMIALLGHHLLGSACLATLDLEASPRFTPMTLAADIV